MCHPVSIPGWKKRCGGWNDKKSFIIWNSSYRNTNQVRLGPVNHILCLNEKENLDLHWVTAIAGALISSMAIFSSAPSMNSLTKALSLL